MEGAESKKPSRGERWVAAQIVLLGLIGLSPLTGIGLPEGIVGPARLIGTAVLSAGCIIGILAGLGLGRNLTIFPAPKADGQLVQTGLYGLVRHPIYAGVLLTGLGYALAWASLPALVMTLALCVFFDRKAAAEEKMLARHYPEYPDYARRVRKLIPFIW